MSWEDRINRQNKLQMESNVMEERRQEKIRWCVGVGGPVPTLDGQVRGVPLRSY